MPTIIIDVAKGKRVGVGLPAGAKKLSLVHRDALQKRQEQLRREVPFASGEIWNMVFDD